jgi:hypothetical protein
VSRNAPKAQKAAVDTMECTSAFSKHIVSMEMEVQFGIKLDPKITKGLSREVESNIRGQRRATGEWREEVVKITTKK